MSTSRLEDLIDRHGVDVHEHLDRTELVPVTSGLQFQGDVAVVPGYRKGTGSVPPLGIPVVRGENGGNTHLLLVEGPVLFSTYDDDLILGFLSVPAGATAYLAHPEHGYVGVGAGDYEIRRQREQADVIRRVAD